ncbi:hypothetical protein Hanom_Chr03g00207931 [Helianthus anomalus]
MPIFACIYRVIVVNKCANAMIIMLQVLMSSSESGFSDEPDPMAIVSDDDIAHDPELFTLLDFGDDIPDANDILIDEVFALPIPVHDHLIIGHPDGEHLVAPILDIVPLIAIPTEDWPFDDLFHDDVDLFMGDHPAGKQGDGELDDVVSLDIPPPVVPVIDISSDSSIHSVADSFEYVTSSAL